MWRWCYGRCHGCLLIPFDCHAHVIIVVPCNCLLVSVRSSKTNKSPRQKFIVFKGGNVIVLSLSTYALAAATHPATMVGIFAAAAAFASCSSKTAHFVSFDFLDFEKSKWPFWLICAKHTQKLRKHLKMKTREIGTEKLWKKKTNEILCHALSASVTWHRVECWSVDAIASA